MKTVRHALAFLLSLLLFLSCFAPAAFAQNDPLHYVVLGDSIAAGSGIRNAGDACYGRIVANTNGYTYQNFGHDGHRTRDLLGRLDRSDVKDAVRRADIISISIGGNDFFQSNPVGLVFEVTFRQFSRINSIANEMRSNFVGIMDKIKAYNPHAVILMQTLYNPGTVLRLQIKEATNRVNDMIYDYLREHPGAFEIVDIAGAFGSDVSLIAVDTIHPNAKGNEKIAKVILQKLHDLGLGTRTDPVIVTKGINELELDFSAVRGWFSTLSRFFSRMFRAPVRAA